MPAVTRVNSVRELKALMIESIVNSSAKVTKVANQSILNGIAYGNAKISQKAMKDIGLVESHLFPDSAYGVYLDRVADFNGIAARFSASQSSAYVRLVADPGTSYVSGTHTFIGNGVVFDLEESVTIGALGYAYAKVRSQDSGLATKVEALVITQISPTPSGHKYVINEYEAIGGRDLEDDRLFRIRIKEGPNILGRGTLAMLTQAFQKLNSNVLRLFYQGINADNESVIAIATHNGINLTAAELDSLKDRVEEFLGIRELSLLGFNNPLISLENITYHPIDISFRVQLISGSDVDAVRKDIQIQMSKELDIRFWQPNTKVEWDNLLQIAKDHPKVSYVPDQSFTPSTDISISLDQLPRVRGFLMLDLNGNVISGESGILNPIYYPINPDFSFQATALSSI